MTIGEKIQQLRKTNNLSQEQLAEKLAVSRQAISKWELGSIPDTDKIIQLSRIFKFQLIICYMMTLTVTGNSAETNSELFKNNIT